MNGWRIVGTVTTKGRLLTDHRGPYSIVTDISFAVVRGISHHGNFDLELAVRSPPRFGFCLSACAWLEIVSSPDFLPARATPSAAQRFGRY